MEQGPGTEFHIMPSSYQAKLPLTLRQSPSNSLFILNADLRPIFRKRTKATWQVLENPHLRLRLDQSALTICNVTD